MVGYEIASKLVLPLDVIIPRKLGAPGNSELAIGAVAEDGSMVLDEGLISYLGVSKGYLQEESERQRQEIARRMKVYRGDLEPVKVSGKDIIMVDDGIATGSTMKAALISVINSDAKSVTVAVPVGPPQTIQELKALADNVICLYTPEYFEAIGQFYKDFSQTSDEEVIRLLQLCKESVGVIT